MAYFHEKRNRFFTKNIYMQVIIINDLIVIIKIIFYKYFSYSILPAIFLLNQYLFYFLYMS